jgi:hypothetical protein
MKLIATIAALTIAACSFLATTASSATTYRWYTDELVVGNHFEAKGFTWGGRHHDVDTGVCSGLRRYGVQPNDYGLDKFWVFNCDAFTSDGSDYTLRVWTTVTGRYHAFFVKSVSKEF